MKRTKTAFKVTAILTADWHLREDQPLCRTDDFWTAQGNKLVEIADLQRQYECPIIHAGDVFHHWKPSPLVMSQFLSNFHPKSKYPFLCIFGNHDLPQHNIEYRHKSGLHTLIEASAATMLPSCHWGQKPEMVSLNVAEGKILVWHTMTYTGKKPWPNCTDPNAQEILDDLNDVDLIVTGHNHKSFVVSKGNRLLVNPGSITRFAADQIDHRPCVYLWDGTRNTVRKHVLKHSNDVITREHLEQKRKKEERYAAFIENLRQKGEPELSFRTNLDRHFSQNKTTKSVKQLVYEMLE